MSIDLSLTIGLTQTQLKSADSAVFPMDITLALGTSSIAEVYFHQPLPTPLELENAISGIEDEIARAKLRLPSEAKVHTPESGVFELARHAHPVDKDRLDMGDVEALFQRLCARSLGRPQSQDASLANDSGLFAQIVILRELMHHLDIRVLDIISDR
jgi:hypothetical protein